MNWKPFLSKLQKIKVLAENAESDGQMSKLEHDLLAAYIRELYELLHAEHAAEPVKKAVKPEPVFVPAPEVSAPAVVEIPVVVSKPETTIVEKIQKPVEIPTIVETITETVQVPVAVPQVTEPVKIKAVDQGLLAELFTEEKVNDLSDKLASQKINDLTKAMGINERIFTIQELFNNDNGLFSKSMEKLNGLPDFETAKTYLSQELIPQLDWTSEKKIKKAATFIKLVRRRYMS